MLNANGPKFAGLYTITQSNVAALIHVSAPDGATYDCIYIADGKPIEAYRNNNMARDVAADLPFEVRAAVSRDFGVTFSIPHEMPYSARARHLRECKPYTVEVDHA